MEGRFPFGGQIKTLRGFYILGVFGVGSFHTMARFHILGDWRQLAKGGHLSQTFV